jgi:protein-S-isoprenylcysteine O-methyltransferase Ste14
MWCIVTIAVSFFSLFLYDLFQVRGGRIYTLLFSIIGYGGLFLSHFFLVLEYLPAVRLDAASVISTVLGGGFLLLLFYSLFVEIPLKGTYSGGDGRRVFSSGTYGFIRHPGFLWFVGFQVCLMVIFRRSDIYLFSCVTILLNFGLILVEDVWIFPRLFEDYTEYKRKVPFLIPEIFGSGNE